MYNFLRHHEFLSFDHIHKILFRIKKHLFCRYNPHFQPGFYCRILVHMFRFLNSFGNELTNFFRCIILEALSNIDPVVFDKTGTITEGRFAVDDIHPDEISKAELLDIAACCESYSSHPVAESVVIARKVVPSCFKSLSPVSSNAPTPKSPSPVPKPKSSPPATTSSTPASSSPASSASEHAQHGCPAHFPFPSAPPVESRAARPRPQTQPPSFPKPIPAESGHWVVRLQKNHVVFPHPILFPFFLSQLENVVQKTTKATAGWTGMA